MPRNRPILMLHRYLLSFLPGTQLPESIGTWHGEGEQCLAHRNHSGNTSGLCGTSCGWWRVKNASRTKTLGHVSESRTKWRRPCEMTSWDVKPVWRKAKLKVKVLSLYHQMDTMRWGQRGWWLIFERNRHLSQRVNFLRGGKACVGIGLI